MECLIVVAEKKDVVNAEVFLWLFWVARPHPDCRRRRSRGLTRRRVEFLKGLLLALYWRANGSHEMFREPRSFSMLRRTTEKGKRSREKKGAEPIERDTPRPLPPHCMSSSSRSPLEPSGRLSSSLFSRFQHQSPSPDKVVVGISQLRPSGRSCADVGALESGGHKR